MDAELPIAYFNYAGLTPACDEACRYLRTVESEFAAQLFSESGVERYIRELAWCRKQAAGLLNVPGAEDDNIAIIPNASYALKVLISALSLSPPATVLTSEHEHPSVSGPLDMLARKGVEIVRVAGDGSDEIEQAIREESGRHRIDLIILSHVSYKDGRIFPVEKIAAIANALGVPFIADGTQAAGHIRTDVAAIRPSVYLFSGHKWLAGPMGIGAMWVDRDFSAKFGGAWTSWASKVDDDARRFEGGTTNIGLVAGLGKAMELAVRFGEQRHRTLAELRPRVLAALAPFRLLRLSHWRGEHAPGIASYSLPDEIPSGELAERLLRQCAVAVKPVRPPEEPNGIRISWSPETRESDLDRLTDSLRKDPLFSVAKV